MQIGDCIPDKELPAILLLLNAWMVEAHEGANGCDSLSLLLFIWLTLCSYKGCSEVLLSFN